MINYKTIPRFFFDLTCLSCEALVLPSVIKDISDVSKGDLFVCFGCMKINIVEHDRHHPHPFRSITEVEYISLVNDADKWDLILKTRGFIREYRTYMPPALRQVIDSKPRSI